MIDITLKVERRTDEHLALPCYSFLTHSEPMDSSSRLDLADAVTRERTLRGMSVARAAALAGMSHVTWMRIEKAEAVQPGKLAGVDRAFHWALGTAARILEGETPPQPDPRIIEIERSTVFTRAEKDDLIERIRSLPPSSPSTPDQSADAG